MSSDIRDYIENATDEQRTLLITLFKRLMKRREEERIEAFRKRGVNLEEWR